MSKAQKSSDTSEVATEQTVLAASSAVPAPQYSDDDFLTSEQLCQKLGLSYTRLKRWNRNGVLPLIRPPGERKILYCWGTVRQALLRMERTRQS